MLRNIQLSNIINNDKIIIGDNIMINGLNLINRKSEFNSVLSYITSHELIHDVEENMSVSALIISHDLYDDLINIITRKITYILSSSPEQDFYEIHQFLFQKTDFYEKYNFNSIIGNNVNVHKSAIIENGVVIGDNVSIGANSIIHSGVVIKDSVSIGCNTVIGSEGFQIIQMKNGPIKINHVGKTIISNNAIIENNTVIDRNLFEGFVDVGENVIIGSLCNISHNCIIRKNSVITAGVILCGSVVIEENVWLGMNVTVLNKVVIGRGAKIGIGSVVTRDIPNNTLAYGCPAKIKKNI
jgi:UDP-3-O-[3-hydroxymyristoyl] glucosamine N-acyltransferase